MVRLRVLAVVVALAGAVEAQELSFRVGGRESCKMTLAELTTRFKAETLTLTRPGGAEAYLVIPMTAVLAAVYGDPYREPTDYFFVRRDGFRAPVQGEELEAFPAYLAIGRADGKPFVEPKENKPLAPFCLLWDTNKFPDRLQQGAWPFQLAAIDRQVFSARCPKVLPPPASSAEVMRGFKAFRKYCVACHQINGQGGQTAIDLNYPHSVVEYIHEPYLARLIDDPQKVRDHGTMPGLIRTAPSRDQMIRDLIAYLKAKAAERRR